MLHSPLKRAEYVQTVKLICGYNMDVLKKMTIQLQDSIPPKIMKRKTQTEEVVTVDKLFVLICRLHNHESWAHLAADVLKPDPKHTYIPVLRAIATVQKAQQKLQAAQKDFIKQHTPQAALEANFDFPLDQAVILDCTDELREAPSDSYGKTRYWSSKSHKPALVYARAHLTDGFALWTSHGYAANLFAGTGSSNIDTFIVESEDFIRELVQFADAMNVRVLHVLGDKAYRFVRVPLEHQGRVQFHVCGPLTAWNQQRYPYVSQCCQFAGPRSFRRHVPPLALGC